jgi:hypothetical protein
MPSGSSERGLIVGNTFGLNRHYACGRKHSLLLFGPLEPSALGGQYSCCRMIVDLGHCHVWATRLKLHRISHLEQ